MRRGIVNRYVNKWVINRSFMKIGIHNDRIKICLIKDDRWAIITVFIHMIEDILRDYDPLLTIEPDRYKNEDGKNKAYELVMEKLVDTVRDIADLIRRYIKQFSRDIGNHC